MSYEAGVAAAKKKMQELMAQQSMSANPMYGMGNALSSMWMRQQQGENPIGEMAQGAGQAIQGGIQGIQQGGQKIGEAISGVGAQGEQLNPVQRLGRGIGGLVGAGTSAAWTLPSMPMAALTNTPETRGVGQALGQIPEFMSQQAQALPKAYRKSVDELFPEGSPARQFMSGTADFFSEAGTPVMDAASKGAFMMILKKAMDYVKQQDAQPVKQAEQGSSKPLPSLRVDEQLILKAPKAAAFAAKTDGYMKFIDTMPKDVLAEIKASGIKDLQAFYDNASVSPPSTMGVIQRSGSTSPLSKARNKAIKSSERTGGSPDNTQAIREYIIDSKMSRETVKSILNVSDDQIDAALKKTPQ